MRSFLIDNLPAALSRWIETQGYGRARPRSVRQQVWPEVIRELDSGARLVEIH